MPLPIAAIAGAVAPSLIGALFGRKNRADAKDQAKMSAAEQYMWHLRALDEAQRRSNFNQETPWGSLTYEGTPGTPGYKRVVSLNPQVQAIMDSRRGIQNELLSALLGGQSLGAA